MPQNQAKLRRYRTSPKHKFGYDIPRNNDYDHAISIENKNDNQKWSDGINLEMDQKHQYNTHEDMGTGQAPKDNKKNRAHFVFDVKHDGTHKARLVADGHLTDVAL